jgi:hypothetical protein
VRLTVQSYLCKTIISVADLVLNSLALTPRGSETLLLHLHLSECDRLVPALLPRLLVALLHRLVPALLLRHALARLPRLVPALLPRLVPALPELIALLHEAGGALLLHHALAELFEGSRAFSHHGRDADLLGGGGALPDSLRPGDGDLDLFALGGWLVPALLLKYELADGGVVDEAGLSQAGQAEGQYEGQLHG